MTADSASRAEIVILGAGQAGLQAALSLREEGFAGSLRLIGDEPVLPYQRPPLSKGFLLGTASADSLQLRPQSLLDSLTIGMTTGARAVAIERAGRELVFADGKRLGYGHLILATGSRARRWTGPGAELDGVTYLRTLADAHDLAMRMPAAKEIVVIGAGFVGLEFAAGAAKAGKSVSVVEAAALPMARAITPAMAELFRGWHEAAGIRLHLGVRLDGFEGRGGKVAGVRLEDGRLLPADLVLVGIGGIANAELAAAAGLPVEGGIVVDALLRTPDPAISAIGDCVSHPNVFAGGQARIESVQNAIDQGRAIAATLTGNPLPYRAVPWFWSDQGELKLQMAGLVAGADRLVEIGSRADKRLSLLAFREGRFIGVESVNRPADNMLARRILGRPEPLGYADAEAAGFDLKALAAAARAG